MSTPSARTSPSMPLARRFPSEAVRADDPEPGVVVWQMTRHPSIEHHLYFLTSSMTPDGGTLVFASYRSGRPNFYATAFPEGDIVQLTDAEGINPFSGTLDARGGMLYFTRLGEVHALDLASGEQRLLADFGGGRLGECSLSADQRYLVAALTRDGRSAIAVTASDGGGGSIIHVSPRTVIHPQFHPSDPTLIEYAGDPAPRMWTIRADGSDNTALWVHDDAEFLVHETFIGRGDELVVVRWPYALQRFHLASRTMSHVAAFNAWHPSPSRDGRFVVCDTTHPDIGLQVVSMASGRRRTLCHPRSSNGGTQWKRDRYAVGEPWTDMTGDTVYGPQWTHPHPSFAAGDRRVVFTSDRTGRAQVYVAELPAGFLDALGP